MKILALVIFLIVIVSVVGIGIFISGGTRAETPPTETQEVTLTSVERVAFEGLVYRHVREIEDASKRRDDALSALLKTKGVARIPLAVEVGATQPDGGITLKLRFVKAPEQPQLPHERKEP